MLLVAFQENALTNNKETFVVENKLLMVFLLSYRQIPFVKKGRRCCILSTEWKGSGEYNFDFIDLGKWNDVLSYKSDISF